MQQINLTTTAWTKVVDSSTTDIIVQAQGGSARLATVDEPGSIAIGISLANGATLVVPAGVDVFAVATGTKVSVVTGAFGVA